MFHSLWICRHVKRVAYRTKRHSDSADAVEETGGVVMKILQVAANFRQCANERPSFWSNKVTLWPSVPP